MRDAEFKALAISLLETIAINTRRIAEACERAEKWTTTGAAPEATDEPGGLTVSACQGTTDITSAIGPGPRRKRGKRG